MMMASVRQVGRRGVELCRMSMQWLYEKTTITEQIFFCLPQDVRYYHTRIILVKITIFFTIRSGRVGGLGLQPKFIMVVFGGKAPKIEFFTKFAYGHNSEHDNGHITHDCVRCERSAGTEKHKKSTNGGWRGLCRKHTFCTGIIFHSKLHCPNCCFVEHECTCSAEESVLVN